MARNSGGSATLSYHPSVLSPERQIAERVWESSVGAADVAFVILHGGGIHSGWYGEIGDALCSLPDVSVRVSCADFPSHGLSDDEVSGGEFRTYVSNFDDFATESAASIARAREAVGSDKKIFVMGESMGGLVLMSGLTDGVIHDIDGVILCGALLELAPALKVPGFMVPIIRLIALIRPRFPLPVPLGGDTYDRAFADADCAKLARNDPLSLDSAPPRAKMALGAFAAMRRVREQAPGTLKIKSLLMMHYKGDERTSFEATADIFSKLDFVHHKEMYPVDGSAHQLFQDKPKNTQVHIGVMAKFITEQVVVPSVAAEGIRKTTRQSRLS